MKFQLTKQKTITPVIGAQADYENQEMSDAVLVREWDIFRAVEILQTIQRKCPGSDITLRRLVKWQVEIPEHREQFYTHLLVGSIHTDIYVRGVRFLEDVVFKLDYIDIDKDGYVRGKEGYIESPN